MAATDRHGPGRAASALLAGLLLLTGAAGATPEADTDTDAAWRQERGRTFDQVWSTVNEAYFDPKFGGVDWAAVRERYRPAVAEAADRPALRQLLQRMLGELNRSHFNIVPRDAAVFTPAERPRIGTTGAELGWLDFGLVALRVRDGSPAAAAGLRPGDRIRRLGDREIAEVSRRLLAGGVEPFRRTVYLEQWAQAQMRAPVGSVVTVEIERPDGAAAALQLESGPHPGHWSEPAGNFPSQPIEFETALGADGIAYLRFNVFTRELMKDLRGFLKAVPADGGLVIDLRGNGGGIALMAPGISGWLCAEERQLGQMLMRQGHLPFVVHPQEGAFQGPVALLIDSRSASTAEIFAGGLREIGRARVFGERSAGAALPSSFAALPSGDLLQYAIAEVLTPRGGAIEGRGIQPDVLAEVTVADLAAGRDPARDDAEAWLRSRLAVRSKGAAEP